MKQLLSILTFFFAVYLSRAQAPDLNFTEKTAIIEGRAHHKLAHFIESQSYADYDLVWQRLYLEF